MSGDAGFLPVIDYFLAPHQDEQAWHLVTPFLPEGNLKSLAERLRDSEISYTAADLDVIFRPSLHHLLEALGRMHNDYQLCHDDIKLDNVFLSAVNSSSEPFPHSQPIEITHWLLGDLGNVRQREHQYHQSLLWIAHGNLKDCRANDVYRLMKVYMSFLSLAVDDGTRFDEEFFRGSQPWSRLYWSIHHVAVEGTPVTATSVRDLSVHRHDPISLSVGRVAHQHPIAFNPMYRLFASPSWTSRAARLDMLDVWNGDKIARFWGMVPLFGIPHSSCWVD